MKKFTQSLNSPKKIAAFVVCVVLIAGAVGFATLQVGANVNANKTIGMDKGVAVALADAGFKSEEVTDLTAHYDDEDGVAAYDVDFTVNGYEYEYTIKASDGKILEAQREKIKADDTEKVVADKTDASTSSTPDNGSSSEGTGTSSTDNPSSKYIGVDKAKSIALKDAGVSASSVTFTKAKLDKDDGVTVYEIEFYSGDTEYEYEINATSGAIRERDSEHRDYDDWDDDDDDDHDDDDEWDD
ncbi:MAG: PepSY domain-containing protein [Anaerovoracaceae bacterium]